MLNALIFDLDMTLIDSLDAATRGANLLAKHFALEEKTSQEILRAISLPTANFWLELWGCFDKAWVAYFAEEVVPKVVHYTNFYPETEPLLKAAKNKGILLGLATNRVHPWLDLASMGLASFFDTAVGASDVPKAKPEPDILINVLKQLGIGPSEAIFVGDSISDMMASKAAGIKAVGLLQSGAPSNSLYQAGAWSVCQNLGACRTILNL